MFRQRALDPVFRATYIAKMLIECVRVSISYPEPAIFRRRIESSGIIHNRKPEILAFFARLLHSFLYQQPIRFTQIHGLSQSSRFLNEILRKKFWLRNTDGCTWVILLKFPTLSAFAVSRNLMDHLHYRLNFDLNKSRQKFHHSLKEHHKISNIPKFRCEML